MRSSLLLLAACSAPVHRVPDPVPSNAAPVSIGHTHRGVIELETWPAMLDTSGNHHIVIDDDGRVDFDQHVCWIPRARVDALLDAFVAAGIERPFDPERCTGFDDHGVAARRCKPLGMITDVGSVVLTYRRGAIHVVVEDMGFHEFRGADALRQRVESAVADRCSTR